MATVVNCGPADSDTMSIRVIDNEPGIAAGKPEAVFELPVQADR